MRRQSKAIKALLSALGDGKIERRILYTDKDLEHRSFYVNSNHSYVDTADLDFLNDMRRRTLTARQDHKRG